ncbi:MAG: hypothetical protein LH480_11125 [Rubrivivax sp.]|nr:hypothetical protein [Rubrivivax sp.]
MASTGPYNLPLATALGRSEPLSDLLRRLRQSQARLALVTPQLPSALRPFVSAGPLDDQAWVLIAANAAAAAKLRQLAPQLTAVLLANGFDGPPLKIKVGSRA